MILSQVNVKFKIQRFLSAEDSEDGNDVFGGLGDLEEIACEVEGCWVRTKARLEKSFEGVELSQMKDIVGQISVKRCPMFDSATGKYTDVIDCGLREGDLVTLTHEKHPIVKCWDEISRPDCSYFIAFVHDSSGMEDIILFLKTRDLYVSSG